MGRRKKLGPKKKKEKKKNPFESGACASLDVHSISCCFFFFRTIIFDSFLAWGWLAPTDITARLHVQLLSKSQENPFRNKKKEEEEKKRPAGASAKASRVKKQSNSRFISSVGYFSLLFGWMKLPPR